MKATPPWELIGLGVLTIAALALRLSQINQSIGADEVFTYQDVVGRSLTGVVTTVHNGIEDNPPLFFALAWAAAKLGHPSEWIRLPSIILGTATVPVTYALGRQAVGRTAAVVGAAMMALAPFAVFYGIEARPSATMMFFVAVSTLALLRALQTRAAKWWLVYALAAAAAAYSHYTSIFLLGAQALWSLYASRKSLRAPLVANALVGILYIPWLPDVRGKTFGVIGTVYPLSMPRVLSDLLRPLPGHPAAPLRVIPTIPGLIAIAACGLGGLLLLTLWHDRVRAADFDGYRHLGLLVLLTLVTPVGLLLYSLIGKDIWLPRGLSSSMPAEALVLGVLLTAGRVRFAAVSSTLVLAILLFGTLRSFEPAYTRGPYRSVASYIDRVASPQEPVYVLSLVGDLAVPEQSNRRHLYVHSLGQLWQASARTGQAVFVIDSVARRRLGTPHPARFHLVTLRHYGGVLPTDVLVYARNT